MSRTINDRSGGMRGLWLLVHTSFTAAPAQTLMCLTETVGVGLTLLQPVILARLVSSVAAREPRSVAQAIVALLIVFGVSRALFAIGITARIGQLERMAHHFDTNIARLVATVPTVDHLDDPAYLDQTQVLREEHGALGLAVNQLLNAVNTAVGVLGTVAVAVTADPRLVLVAAAGLPLVLATPLTSRWERQAEDASAEPGRLSAHLVDLSTQARSGAELRVFGLSDPLRRRLDEASRAWRRPKVRTAARVAAMTAGTHVVFYATAAAILGWMLLDLTGGVVELASFTLALLLINRLQGISSETRSVIGNLAALARTAGRYLWLVDFHRRSWLTGWGTATAPSVLRHGLHLDHLTYTYPGGDRPSLDDVSADLSPGSTVAIVGENGAGKSTLANLIAGLSLPSSGRLLVDGVPLSTYDPTTWRAASSAAFQDHTRFEFTVATTVGIGDVLGRTPARVAEAVRAGASATVIDRLPLGADTQLGASWPGGVDLSGGQWQRLAIARGLMRVHPAVRILDEPTAALDAAAEHDIFTSFAHSSAADDHTLTVLVTHRYSTVAGADLILVLHDGQLVESGTHAELLAAAGRYSVSYLAQRDAYR